MIQLNFNMIHIIAISDTHGKHRDLNIPNCDILIHCGDVCVDGDNSQIHDFFDWFSSTPSKYKLFVSGNHDYPFVFEPHTATKLIPKNIILLEDKIVKLGGINFYGIKSQCNLFEIPEISKLNIDFLLTHVPPKNILDTNFGCQFLLKFVKMQKPKYHIFGHAHKFANQRKTINETTFINASIISDAALINPT